MEPQQIHGGLHARNAEGSRYCPVYANQTGVKLKRFSVRALEKEPKESGGEIGQIVGR